MARRLVWAVVAAAALALSVPAHAESTAPKSAADGRDQSRAAFRRGVEQARSGDFRSARDSFGVAYKLFPHPSILLNLGIARWHTGEYVEAEQDLARFLSDDGGAGGDEVSSARAALAEVRSHLGTVQVRASPETARIKIDDKATARVAGSFTEVRVVLGAHTVTAEAEGFSSVSRTFVALANAPASVDIELSPRSDPAETLRSDDARAIVGYSLVGVAGAAMGTGIFSALRARTLADDYNSRGSGSYQDPDTRSVGIMFRTLADVSWCVAIVSAGVGAYLLLTPTKAPAAAARVYLGPFGAHGEF